MKIRTVQVKDDLVVIPAFTSREETEKAPVTSVIRYYPVDYMPMVLSMDKPIIINLFGEDKFILEQRIIKELLLPIVTEQS